MSDDNPYPAWWVEIFLDASDGESVASAHLHAHEHEGLSVVAAIPQDDDRRAGCFDLVIACALHELADLLVESATASTVRPPGGGCEPAKAVLSRHRVTPAGS